MMKLDEGLAERIMDMLSERHDVVEKKMFGGLAFMVDGYMAVGILGDTLMARIGPDNYDKALTKPHVRMMDFTGKPMKGYVFVDPEGLESDEELKSWVDMSIAFVETLPPRHSV